jgi:hypothetical protein
MTRSGKTARPTGDDDDFTHWDETIFDRCLRAGFNPFGSGPTPIFLRQADQKECFGKPNVPRKDGCDRDNHQ